jgi:SAM-dependent methyltransferase
MTTPTTPSAGPEPAPIKAIEGYQLIKPDDLTWRPSNLMRIPNADYLERTGSQWLGARLWRLPPKSANTLHKHILAEEFYFVLEGTGRIRIGGESLTVPRYGGVLVGPSQLRQVFNDTDAEALWLIVGAPETEIIPPKPSELSLFYPVDPKQLPRELAGVEWPPAMPTQPKTSPASTERFSDRVENYVRHRPSYPAGVIETLRAQAGLVAGAQVADIGSGTGIFAQLLLPHCARVYGIEPNAAMRLAGEKLLGHGRNFESRAGTAEATGLSDASVDLVTAAQAFHWFDVAACRREFQRILRPGKMVALVWNERLTEATPFLRDYENLLERHATDYAQVNHAKIDAARIAAFFGSGGHTVAEFPSEQSFDYEGLKGRLLSSSYAPNAGHPGHEPMIAELAALFSRHEQQGAVSFLYTTKLHHGRLS